MSLDSMSSELTDMLIDAGVRSLVEQSDVVAVLSDDDGVIDVAMGQSGPICAHVLVIPSIAGLVSISRTWGEWRGTTVMPGLSVPARDLPSIARSLHPTVAIVDLRGREVTADVVWALAQPLSDLTGLALIYDRETDLEQIVGIDEMLLTWADEPDDRWRSVERGNPRVRMFER